MGMELVHPSVQLPCWLNPGPSSVDIWHLSVLDFGFRQICHLFWLPLGMQLVYRTGLHNTGFCSTCLWQVVWIMTSNCFMKLVCICLSMLLPCIGQLPLLLVPWAGNWPASVYSMFRPPSAIGTSPFLLIKVNYLFICLLVAQLFLVKHSLSTYLGPVCVNVAHLPALSVTCSCISLLAEH